MGLSFPTCKGRSELNSESITVTQAPPKVFEATWQGQGVEAQLSAGSSTLDNGLQLFSAICSKPL